MNPRQRALLVVGTVLAALLLLMVWLSNRPVESVTPTASVTPLATGRSSVTPRPSGSSGLPPCAGVPKEVDAAVAAVRSDGPYLRPRDDGGTFGNRERLLPAKPRGYYREYTVRAPGVRFPGPRRLVTGGQVRRGAEPEVWFYTADHYESFCELRVS